MSKAFTREDDAVPEPLNRNPPVRLLPGEERYITREGWNALVQERDRLTSNHPRAIHLATLLPLLTVVEPRPLGDPPRVFFGAWVSLEDEDGKVLRYRIVGPDEADARQGLLSVDSPLARALLGKSPGDSLQVPLPKGSSEWTVIEVGLE